MKLAGPLPLRITRRNDGDCRGNYAEELCRCSVVGAMVSNVIDLRMEQRCSGIFRGQGRELRWADLVLVFSVPGEQQNSLRRFNPNCYRVIVDRKSTRLNSSHRCISYA